MFYEYLDESINLVCKKLDLLPPAKLQTENVTSLNHHYNPDYFDEQEALEIDDEIEELLQINSRVDRVIYDEVTSCIVSSIGKKSRKLSNLSHQIGRLIYRDEKRILISRVDEAGFALYGPYMRLSKGQYRCQIEVQLSAYHVAINKSNAVGFLDVCSSNATVFHYQREIILEEVLHANVEIIIFNFLIKKTVTDLQIRLRCVGVCELTINADVLLKPL